MNPAKRREIFERFRAANPNPTTELKYTTPFELLVAVVLSAQATDKSVNLATEVLYKKYNTPQQIANLGVAGLEKYIQRIGLYRTKAKNVVELCRILVEKHGGEVPTTREELEALPGVGRKTANVVLGHALGVPGLPVDRHVLRVATRLGIAASDDPEVVEKQLCAAVSRTRWTRTSDVLILHGRRVCRPTPLCDRCNARDLCRYYAALSTPAAARARKASPAMKRARAAATATARRVGKRSSK